MYVCMYVYMYVCMYLCMCICMYVCMYLCMCICMYVCMYVYMYVCMYVCLFVCGRKQNLEPFQGKETDTKIYIRPSRSLRGHEFPCFFSSSCVKRPMEDEGSAGAESSSSGRLAPRGFQKMSDSMCSSHYAASLKCTTLSSHLDLYA